MKRAFVVWSALNGIGFGVRVKEEDYEKAKELAKKGFDRWNNPEEYPEYHDVGWAEPSMELMDEAGIEYEILEINEDDDEFPDWCEEIVE